MKKLLILLSATALFGCSKQTLTEKLHGTWSNSETAFSIAIDTKSKAISGVAMGEEFAASITKLEEKNDYLVFETSTGAHITAQFTGDDKITLTKQGGVPVQCVRSSKEANVSAADVTAFAAKEANSVENLEQRAKVIQDSIAASISASMAE